MAKLTCYAHGRPGAWEAICVDLDIAVAGESLDAVVASLEKAVLMHVETVSEMREPARSQLLARRAPLRVRLGYLFSYIASLLRPSRAGDELHAGFELPLPA